MSTIEPHLPSPAAKQVLLVEDDEDIRAIVEEFLSGEGYTIESVGSATDALTYLRENGQPDLALVDLSLPQISGAELIERMNAMPNRGEMKIVLASGWDDLATRARELETDGYLKKPFDLHTLLQKVESSVRPH